MNRAAGNPEGAAELRCQEPELAEACRDLIQQEEEQEQDLILEHTVYTKVNIISGLKKKRNQLFVKEIKADKYCVKYGCVAIFQSK